MSVLRCWACVVLLAACRIDQLESASELGRPSEPLDLTREPAAAPPRIRTRLELSEFAVADFVELALRMRSMPAFRVTVEAGQGFAGQGLSAEWVEGAEGVGESADFTGPLWNQIALHALPSALSCERGACSIVLELAPRGAWQSDVAYPLRYRAHATLLLERSERLPHDSDLDERLELAP